LNLRSYSRGIDSLILYALKYYTALPTDLPGPFEVLRVFAVVPRGRDEDSQSSALKRLRYRLRVTTLSPVDQKIAIGVSIDQTEPGTDFTYYIHPHQNIELLPAKTIAGLSAVVNGCQINYPLLFINIMELSFGFFHHERVKHLYLVNSDKLPI
jgi:hypothetical protein